jgi:hypothetical protein
MGTAQRWLPITKVTGNAQRWLPITKVMGNAMSARAKSPPVAGRTPLRRGSQFLPSAARAGEAIRLRRI